MEINISELREKRRPLWMTHLGVESYADLVGGGGDIRTDRLHPEWMRDGGEEVDDTEDLKVLLEGRYVEEDCIS